MFPRALALMGLLLLQEPIIDELIRKLGDESIEKREQAAVALIELGERAVEKLKSVASGSDGDLKARAEAVLKSIERNRVLRTTLPPLRRVSLEARDQTLGDVLKEFQAMTGIEVLANPHPTPVSVSLKEATPMEALDAICDAAGLTYGLESSSSLSPPPSLRLKSGPRYAPRAYIRHYVVRSTRTRLTKEDPSTLSINLELLFPPTVRPAGVWKAQVESMVDDKGREIYNRKNDPGAWMHGDLGKGRPMAGVERGGHAFHLSIPAPEKDLEGLSSVKGEIEVRYHLERKLAGFDSPADQVGKIVEYNDTTFKLTSFGHTGEGVTFGLEMTGCVFGPGGPAGRGLDFQTIALKTECGTVPHRNGIHGRRGPGNTYTALVHFLKVKSKVTRIEFEVDATYHADIVKFELRDIPLPK